MKLYCGTYKKYNEGSLKGAWMDLDEYEDADAFIHACYELHKDEKDPELMFQDVEIENDWEDGLYSECSVPRDYWNIKEALEEEHVDEDLFNAFIQGKCERASVEMVTKCQQCYTGYHYTDTFNAGEQYAQDEFYETHSKQEIDSMEWILRYVDWERVWSDMTYDGYAEYDGYIFNNNW